MQMYKLPLARLARRGDNAPWCGWPRERRVEHGGRSAEARIAAFQGMLRGAGVDATLLLNPPDVFSFAGAK
jgi:hypothetical protein